MTPTARSLRFLRQSGYTADVVERWMRRQHPQGLVRLH